MIASLKRSIQELRLSADRESSAHKRIHDLGHGGLFLVKDHCRLVVRRLGIPHQFVRKNSLLRFQDIPYPVPGVPSPAGKRNVDLEEHGLVIGFGSCQRPCREQQQGSKQKDHSEISIFHVITPQVKDALY